MQVESQHCSAFQKNEIDFLERLQKFGEIKPELLTDNADFCERVKRHPLLRWRAHQGERN